MGDTINTIFVETVDVDKYDIDIHRQHAHQIIDALPIRYLELLFDFEQALMINGRMYVKTELKKNING